MKIQRYCLAPEPYNLLPGQTGSMYKVADVDPVIAKLKAEKLELIQMQREQADKYLDMKDKLEAENEFLKEILKASSDKIESMLDKFGYEYSGGMPINGLRDLIKQALKEK